MYGHPHVVGCPLGLRSSEACLDVVVLRCLEPRGQKLSDLLPTRWGHACPPSPPRGHARLVDDGRVLKLTVVPLRLGGHKTEKTGERESLTCMICPKLGWAVLK